MADRVKYVVPESKVPAQGLSLRLSVAADKAMGSPPPIVDPVDGSAEASELQLLGQGLYERLKQLAKDDRFPEVVETADMIIERLGQNADPAARRLVARALLDRTIALALLGRWSEAEPGFEHLVNDLADEVLAALEDEAERLAADDANTPERLAATLQLQAIILRELGRDTESRDAFAAVIARFEDHEDPNIVPIVQVARELQDRPPERDGD